ncbi:hypothetical protein ABRY23_04210 [Melioribacteraceae bacterium 4301-Me]|uniref:hypothetical protein n=1 Tax=Pyranulibacter aquaticus TaxID=3163344 RepID=UPI003598B1B7
MAQKFHLVFIKIHKKQNEIKANLLRLGVAKRDGFGYKLNTVTVLPYHQTGFIWSQFDFKNYPTYLTNYEKNNSSFGPINDIQILDRYNKQTRFGTLAESGIRLDLQSSISFNIAYETSIIFSRHLFWKYSASYLLESIGSQSLDYFINRILETSPHVVPIVNFVLKNAYSYGWYLLKKDKMNWPFDTDSPIAVEFFKVGITFTF